MDSVIVEVIELSILAALSVKVFFSHRAIRRERLVGVARFNMQKGLYEKGRRVLNEHIVAPIHKG